MPMTGDYVAGLVDGEGCFSISRTTSSGYSFRCEFTVHLRMDDRQLLEDLRRFTGLGKVVNGRKTHGTGDRADCPSARWVVIRKAECIELAQFFRAHPLRSKKARDFEVWAAAVDAWSRGAYGEMERLRDVLKALRPYSSELEEDWQEEPEPQLILSMTHGPVAL